MPNPIIRAGFRDSFTPGHAIFLAHPFTEIHELAAFGTKRSKGIVLPLYVFVAGGTLHR
jgi:hypothetical protein